MCEGAQKRPPHQILERRRAEAEAMWGKKLTIRRILLVGRRVTTS